METFMNIFPWNIFADKFWHYLSKYSFSFVKWFSQESWVRRKHKLAFITTLLKFKVISLAQLLPGGRLLNTMSFYAIRIMVFMVIFTVRFSQSKEDSKWNHNKGKSMDEIPPSTKSYNLVSIFRYGTWFEVAGKLLCQLYYAQWTGAYFNRCDQSKSGPDCQGCLINWDFYDYNFCIKIRQSSYRP